MAMLAMSEMGLSQTMEAELAMLCCSLSLGSVEGAD